MIETATTETEPLALFERVKAFLVNLGLTPTVEDAANTLFVVDDESQGLKHLVIDCDEPIVVLEQFILELPPQAEANTYRRLLQMNRTLVHGAFVLDDTGRRLLFRDTLQLATLDEAELRASILSLTMAMAEHAN